MRTTVTIPDDTLKNIMHYTHAKTRTDAVNIAIQDWVRMKKISKIKELQGRVKMNDDLGKLHAKELNKLEGIR